MIINTIFLLIVKKKQFRKAILKNLYFIKYVNFNYIITNGYNIKN